ncbi:hypothetical protein CVT23_18320 [Minwuia thermotolerans]|uniref:Uncharacterized protein n=1 Tax=Minwuia thermotolerans TaxID=2056226 RepID=A0A2M9FXY4_9PROT|nr:hypothetical protein CVT23_18320 [Minwuia thermotolerans]
MGDVVSDDQVYRVLGFSFMAIGSGLMFLVGAVQSRQRALFNIRLHQTLLSRWALIAMWMGALSMGIGWYLDHHI